jgi:serine protease Do
MNTQATIGRYFTPLALTFATIVATAPPAQVAPLREARALLSRQVGTIAKTTSLRIEEVGDSGRFGSGVIVGRREKGRTNVYSVLTAAHVIRNRNSIYQITTPRPVDSSGVQSRKTISIDPKTDVRFVKGADLAIVTFESNRTFAVATIGDSDYADEGSPVYVAGFPKDATVLTRIAMQFTGGMVSSRLDEEQAGTKAVYNNNNGYDMVYTNVTRSGMSGGPVFDAAGRVVGIHGQGDRNTRDPGKESSDGTVLVTPDADFFQTPSPSQKIDRCQNRSIAY